MNKHTQIQFSKPQEQQTVNMTRLDTGMTTPAHDFTSVTVTGNKLSIPHGISQEHQNSQGILHKVQMYTYYLLSAHHPLVFIFNTAVAQGSIKTLSL